jgi:hypothetical protein
MQFPFIACFRRKSNKIILDNTEFLGEATRDEARRNPMRTLRTRSTKAQLSAGILALLIFLSASPSHVQAQAAAAGNKAVYNSGNSVAPSTVWIDASGFWSSGSPDLCSILNGILLSSSYPSAGAVIDARGIYTTASGNPPGPINCTGNPFSGVPSNLPPSTILLPAGGINVSATWVLPSNVKLIGVSGGAGNTTLVTNSSVTDVIDMGSSSYCSSQPCSGISIEHVSILAKGNALNAIVNNWAQSASYVNDVTIQDVTCAGLIVGAADSGPYSNIYFLTGHKSSSCAGNGGGAAVLYPLCVDIEAQTRGVHGVTCNLTATGIQARQGAAIYVNASNNSVEDAHIETFWDAVQVGDTASAVSNVVVANIVGGNNGSGMIQNIVHICGPHPASGGAPCNSEAGTVTDVSVLQSTYLAGNSTETSVQDDVTGTSIPGSGGNSLTSLYTLGEGVGGGYSFFSTSPTATNTNGSTTGVNWGVADNTINSGESCNTPGALYSNTKGGYMTSVYVCTFSGTLTWLPIA